MCWHEDVGIEAATIIPDVNSLGRVRHKAVLDGVDLSCDSSAAGKARAESLIRIALAGVEAQRRVQPRGIRSYQFRADYATVDRIIHSLAGSDEEVSAYLRLLQIQTKKIFELDHIWAAVERVAAALLAQAILRDTDLDRLVMGR